MGLKVLNNISKSVSVVGGGGDRYEGEPLVSLVNIIMTMKIIDIDALKIQMDQYH